MHNTKPHYPRVRVFGKDWKMVAQYKDIYEAARFIFDDFDCSKYNPDIVFGVEFNIHTEYWPASSIYTIYNSVPRHSTHVIRDEHDNVITLAELKALSNIKKNGPWKRGSSKSCVSYSYKRPKTKQESSQYFAAFDQDSDVTIKVRKKRSPRMLPNHWDDRCYKTGGSWKDWRKTQYRS